MHVEQLSMPKGMEGRDGEREGGGWQEILVWFTSSSKQISWLKTQKRETCTLKIHRQEGCLQIYHHKVKYKSMFQWQKK